MRHRSFGVTTLAFSTIMVALYSQVAAIALLLTGSVFTAAGSLQGAVALITGAVYLGLTVAAYLVGYGLWTGKPWSWAGGLVVFGTLIGASIFLSIISSVFVSALLPSVGAVVGIAYLRRASVRAELLGSEPSVDTSSGTVSTQLDAAEAAR
jgi:hypothetical protein